MDTTGLLDQLLKAGRDLAAQGREAAERQLDIPKEGPERDATLSAMGKGAAAAGVLALLLGTGAGRKITGSALTVGGLAALGGVAYKAYESWRSGQAQTAEPGTAVGDLTGPAAEQRGRALLRAMVAAANADGHMDDAERQRIFAGIDKLGLQDSMAEVLAAELHGPLDPASVAMGAESPEAAAEIYLASLAVIGTENAGERRYLDQLALHLRLDASLVRELEKQAKTG